MRVMTDTSNRAAYVLFTLFLTVETILFQHHENDSKIQSLHMKAVGLSAKAVNFLQTTRRHVPEDETVTG